MQTSMAHVFTFSTVESTLRFSLCTMSGEALTTLQIGRKEKHHHPCYPVLKKSMRSHKHGSTFASACKQLCSWPCESTRPAGLTQAGILMSPKHTLPDAGKENKKTTIYFRRDIIKLFLNSLSI